MTGRRLDWAVVGAGAIAAKVLPDLVAVPGADLVLAGATASDVVPLEGTVAVMRVLDTALDAIRVQRCVEG